jgi:hypothetical protein
MDKQAFIREIVDESQVDAEETRILWSRYAIADLVRGR